MRHGQFVEVAREIEAAARIIGESGSVERLHHMIKASWNRWCKSQLAQLRL
jgi:hypothetical protein